MRLEQGPVFRKAIIPWYDSDALCIALLVFSVVVLGFSVVGIQVAWAETAFHAFAWLPVILGTLAFFVAISVMIRLFRRLSERRSKGD